jgi:hypothetical protein
MSKRMPTVSWISRLWHRSINGIFLFCFGVVIIYGLRFATAVQTGVSHDDAEYIVLAESFATGHPYRLVNYPDAPLETIWPPGYPLLILTIPWALFGPNTMLLRSINLILALANLLLGFNLLVRYLPSPLAFSVVALFAFNPTVVGLATIAMSDTAFTFFTLAFWVTFLASHSGNTHSNLRFLLSLFLLAATILTRYWGIAFWAAAVLYLFLGRRFVRVCVLVVGVFLLLLPFLIFMALPVITSPSSFLVVQLAGLGPGSFVSNAKISLATYWSATPFLLVPVLGPKVTTMFDAWGLTWVLNLINLIIFVLLGIGYWGAFAKQRFLAISVGCYSILLIVLTQHIGQTEVFDEPRYLVPILLFLYAYFLLGIQAVEARILGRTENLWFSSVSAVVLIGALLLRNIQQSTVSFPVADLSAGATWVQANTPRNSVIMSPDPVSRYLYLQRHTVGYPPLVNADGVWRQLAKHAVSYVLVAPPLTLGREPNVAQLLDPRVETILLPLLQDNPECFSLVFQDSMKKTRLFRVNEGCPMLNSGK